MSSSSVPNKKLATNSSTIESDDLLFEILLRLPLRSIHRFKTTCKQWQSLINNPTFRKLCRKKYLKPPTTLILHTKSKPLSFSPFSPNPKPKTIKTIHNIKQSCNGLLLCLTKTRYIVFNLTTDTGHNLPQLGSYVALLPGTRIRTTSLAFDPNRFGNIYKVISCVTLEHSKSPLHVHIYSSDTCLWKSVFNLEYTRPVNDKGVYWNGSIHWMFELTYFDIKNESFNVMPEPPVSQWRTNYYFGESCDSLNYTKLRKSKGGDLPSVDVYELKRDYSEWVLKYHVEFDNLSSVSSVLYVGHGVEEYDSFLVLKAGNEIVRYNLVYGRVEELRFIEWWNY